MKMAKIKKEALYFLITMVLIPITIILNTITGIKYIIRGIWTIITCIFDGIVAASDCAYDIVMDEEDYEAGW